MELETITWQAGSGWSRPLPPSGPGTLVVAFGAPHLDDTPEPLHELLERYAGQAVVGCSGAGEIAGEALTDAGMSVAVARFQRTRVETVTEPVEDPESSYAVGRRLAERLLDAGGTDALRSIFVLSDGLQVNGGALVAGLVAGAGPRVTITGGLAGDGVRFERTWVLADGAVRSGVVTAVGLYGDHVVVGHGSRGGWDPFGPERTVTRAVGNVLYELDGQPALALYKRYLGDRAAGLPATALLFPLSVRVPGRPQRSVTRTILGVDEDTQSLTFAGDVPQGGTAQLMRANIDRLVESAQDAAEGAGAATDAPVLALAISCVGRRLLLGERTEDELEATAAGLPATARMVGFYSYGEISPLTAGTCDLHNQTMTITTISEAA